MGVILKKAFLLFVLIFPVSVYAHSGGLDEKGGHWDTKKGTYHYHKSRGDSSEVYKGKAYFDTYEPIKKGSTFKPRKKQNPKSYTNIPMIRG